MWNANGILIQGLSDKTNYIKNFTYLGINAYYQFPLTWFHDIECRKLTEKQQCKKISDDTYMSLEFISDLELCTQYVQKCREMNLGVRALFIESSYQDEIWIGSLPQMIFMGYEYCPIPIDEQIITDMDWYLPFSKHRAKLNKYGLFQSYADVKEFVAAYHQAFQAKCVGDGDMDAYICRVSQVQL